jgi:hypothetical protein
MRHMPDHKTIAQRYASCAEESIRQAEAAINDKERKYHALIAAEYLLLVNCRQTIGAKAPCNADHSPNGVEQKTWNRREAFSAITSYRLWSRSPSPFFTIRFAFDLRSADSERPAIRQSSSGTIAGKLKKKSALGRCC